jgi:hypothetical protein
VTIKIKCEDIEVRDTTQTQHEALVVENQANWTTFVVYIESQPKVLGVFSQTKCNLGFVILA